MDNLTDDTIIALYYCIGIGTLFLVAAGLADLIEFISNRNKRK